MLFLLVVPVSIYSFTIGQFVNPGIKIGYEFGTNHCWVIGAEISYVIVNRDFFYGGPNIGIIKRISKHGNWVPYCEIETGFGPLGGAVGLEFDKNMLLSYRVFAGGMLYCSYKWTSGTNNRELSSIFKIYRTY